MIAMTSKNVMFVRLTASYDIDAETVEYTVQGSGGINDTFVDFAEAAKAYKDLSKFIETRKEVA